MTTNKKLFINLVLANQGGTIIEGRENREESSNKDTTVNDLVKSLRQGLRLFLKLNLKYVFGIGYALDFWFQCFYLIY
jgi:hypothetical protein